MKKTTLILTMLILCTTSCINELQDKTGDRHDVKTLETKLVGKTDGDMEEGVLLVKVDTETALALENASDNGVWKSIFGTDEIKSVYYALGARPNDMELARKYDLDKWFKVEFDKSIANEDMAQKLTLRPNIISIQYDMRMEAPAVPQTLQAALPPITRSNSATSGLPFDDPYLSSQWNMINDGSMPGSVAGADIGVKDAWKLAAGDPSIIVAVFDDAVHNIHSDLRKAIWVNELEKNGVAGVDDDGNGYVDDINGFNFVGCHISEDKNGNVVTNGKLLDATGLCGHGTHIAGVIGAINGNGKGISSIAGGTGKNDGVRLLSCQIFDRNGNATDSQRAAAYRYAADMGACIAQCSYGNTDIITSDDIYINGTDNDDSIPDDKKIAGAPLEYSALQYFLNKANHPNLDGNLAIYSSMNEGHPYSGYPGALASCISVSAFGYDFTPAFYSNYGPGVKISAPGGEFSSEADKQKAILSTGVSNSATQNPTYTDGNGEDDAHYVYMNGTSMACPHVSGVAALGISYAMKLNKKFTRDEFISKLLTSVNDLDQYCTGTKIYNGRTIDLEKYKGKMGTGALDAWKFLMSLEGTPVIMAKPGVKRSIRIADYLGSNPVILNDIDQETINSLGWESAPIITEDGMLEFTCTKTGAGKISFSSSIGKDPDMADGIGGMNYSYEISITCRNNIASNGGWL